MPGPDLDYVAMQPNPDADAVPPICFCLRVTADDICHAVRGGAHTLAAVREQTGAAAACSSCEGDVEALIFQELEALRRERSLLAGRNPDQLSLFG